MNKLEIISIKNAPVDSNCYLVFDPGTRQSLIIDPGTKDCSLLIASIEENRLNVEFIFLTHEHFDHIWGVNVLKDRYICNIVCSEECANKITDKRKNLSEFFNQKGFETYAADIQFNTDRYVFEWNDTQIGLVKTKGHSEGSICICIGNDLFTGDTVIKNTKTVLKLPDSSRSALLISLQYLKSICNDQTFIYPGHGDSFKYESSALEKCL